MLPQRASRARILRTCRSSRRSRSADSALTLLASSHRWPTRTQAARTAETAPLPPGHGRAARDPALPEINRLAPATTAVCAIGASRLSLCTFGRSARIQIRQGADRWTVSRCIQVREIATEFFEDEDGNGVGLRWQSSALVALQEATEACVFSPSFAVGDAGARPARLLP